MANLASTANGTTIKIGGVKINGFVSFSGLGGGSAAVIEITDLDSAAKEKLPGLPDEGQVTLSFHWIAEDAGQNALETARTAQTTPTFVITTKSGRTFTFSAFVLSAAKSGGVDQVVPLEVVIEITGPVVAGNVTP